MVAGSSNRFFLGLVMAVAGFYLLLNSIRVDFPYGMMGFGRHTMFNMGGVGVTSGYVLIGFMFGVGFLFYNAKNPIGWVLTVSSIVMLIFGVITNTQFHLAQMSAFDLMSILVLLCGGIGLLLSSLLPSRKG